MKLERQIVFGLMKRGRVLFIQRGTEKIQEDQGQSLRNAIIQGWSEDLGSIKGPQDEGAETQRAKEGSISRQERLM